MKREPEKKPEIEESEQTDGNEFARFDDLLRRLISVPKEEIDEEAAEYEKQKAEKSRKK
jgi:hypothetical protein